MRRRTRLLAALAFLTTTAGGCGEPSVGGGGRLEPAQGTSPARLSVEGSPYEMGYWQGRLLAARIREVHSRWQARAFGGGDRGRALREACRLYADQTVRRLPEALRQEVEGIAAGSGAGVADLLLTEVLRDGLRFHGEPAGLAGGLVVRRAGEGREAWLLPEGRDASLLAEEGLLVERRPTGGRATTVFAWPGSLGGVAGVATRGLAALAVPVAAPLEGQGVGEVPFTVRLRLALETAEGVDDLLMRLAGGAAHRVVVADAAGPTVKLGLAALASAQTADLSTLACFLLPAEGEAGEVQVREAEVCPSPAAPAVGFVLEGGEARPLVVR